jgi:hypothetical protein
MSEIVSKVLTIATFCRLFQGENIVSNCFTISKCGSAKDKDLGTHHGKQKFESKLCCSSMGTTIGIQK